MKQRLAELPEKMLEYAFEVLIRQAELMKGLAQVLVRVDTGSLRDSIRIERGGESKAWREVRVRAGGYIINPRTNRFVDYAAIVEAKYPFMEPAWLQVKDQIEAMIKEEVVKKVT